MADRSIPAPPALLLLGVGMGTIEAKRVIMTLEPGEYHYNPPGTVHGGMIATLLDSVMGCAVRSMLPAGRGYTTLEFKVNFVRPVSDRTGVMTAEGHAVHVGRRSAEAEAEAAGPGGQAVCDGEYDVSGVRCAGVQKTRSLANGYRVRRKRTRCCCPDRQKPDASGCRGAPVGGTYSPFQRL